MVPGGPGPSPRIFVWDRTVQSPVRQKWPGTGPDRTSPTLDWTMWVVRSDEDGDGRTKMGMAGRRWGWPDEDGDSRMKMGTNPDKVPASSIAYVWREGSSSGQSVLRGDGRASTEEHVVVISWFPGRICIRNVVVDRLAQGSTWDLTVTVGRGVLQKWDHLISET